MNTTKSSDWEPNLAWSDYSFSELKGLLDFFSLVYAVENKNEF